MRLVAAARPGSLVKPLVAGEWICVRLELKTLEPNPSTVVARYTPGSADAPTSPRSEDVAGRSTLNRKAVLLAVDRTHERQQHRLSLTSPSPPTGTLPFRDLECHDSLETA